MVLRVALQNPVDRTLAIVLCHEVEEVRARRVLAVVPSTAQRPVPSVEHPGGVCAHHVVAHPVRHRLGEYPVRPNVEDMRHFVDKYSGTFPDCARRMLAHLPRDAASGRERGISASRRRKVEGDSEVLVQARARFVAVKRSADAPRCDFHVRRKMVALRPFAVLLRRAPVVDDVQRGRGSRENHRDRCGAENAKSGRFHATHYIN